MDIRRQLPIRKVRSWPQLTKSQRIAVTDEARKRAYDRSSGAYTAHAYHVLTDPEFAHDVELLRRQIEQLYYSQISLTTDANDDHLLLEDKQLIKVVADKYCITLNDLGNYADGLFENEGAFGDTLKEFGGLLQPGHPGFWGICYAIGSKTTLEQIASDWDYIKDMRSIYYGKSSTKSKSPEYPDLIYSVYVLRTRHILRFSEIFERYINDTLPGYRHGRDQTREDYIDRLPFKSEDSLERYYRKYAPKDMKNSIQKAVPHKE